jgi:hypothetical protein
VSKRKNRNLSAAKVAKVLGNAPQKDACSLRKAERQAIQSKKPQRRSNAGRKFPYLSKCDQRELFPSGAAMLEENSPTYQNATEGSSSPAAQQCWKKIPLSFNNC